MTSLNQSPEEIITEIVMSQDGVPWLAVEGDTDERFFRSRKFGREVKIAVGDGWEGVRDILMGANQLQHHTIVVGVIDRDYRDHNSSQPAIQGLVLTDVRDIEGMMFWSSAFDRVFAELGSLEKLPKSKHEAIDYRTIRALISDTCEKVGRFRAYCFISGTNISFRNLDYTKFVCDRSLELDVPKFLNHLRGRNEGANSIEEKDWQIAQSCKHLRKGCAAPELICHGHDLMGLVAVSLRRMWGSHGGSLSRQSIETTFRIGFGNHELEATLMWREICSHLGC